MGFQLEVYCAAAFTVLSVLLALVYRYIKSSHSYFDKRGLTGPEPCIFVGTWQGITKKFLGSEDVLNSKKFGRVFGTYDGLTPHLLVTDPAIVKQILTTSAENFQSRRVLAARNQILQSSLAALQGEGDPQLHALIASSVTEEKVKKMLPRLESSVSSLLQNISKIQQEDGKVNISSAVTQFIHDVSALAIFGIDLNADVDFKDEFIGYSQQILKMRNPNSSLAMIPFLYDSLAGDSWVIPQNALKFFINLIKTGIKETPKSTVLVEGKAVDLIGLLVQASEEERQLVKKKGAGGENEPSCLLSDEVIIAKCVSTLLTLAVSTRNIILLTLHTLAKHPEQEEILHKELKKSSPGERVSFEDLRNSPHLDKVLAEILRLYPSEFRLEKITKETTNFEKITVEKGVRISIPLFALHRDEEIYPEPEKFDPERFSPEVSQKRIPETYLPFGQAGLTGLDLSLQIGILTAKIAVYKLVEKLKFNLSSEEDSNLFQFGLTGVPEPAKVELIVEKRK